PLPLGGLAGRRSLVSVESLSDAVDAVLRAPGPLRRPLIVAEAEALRVPEMIASLRAGLSRRPGLVPMPQVLLDAALALTGRSELRERLGSSLVARTAGLEALGWTAPVETRSGLEALARAGG
ncbi:NAD-dependent dehydratase, partial [Methylobacterium frigidaeris]